LFIGFILFTQKEGRSLSTKHYLNLIKYLTAIAIVISLQPDLAAQTSAESRKGVLGDIREQLTSEWETAVLSRSLESTTPVNAIKFSPNGQLLASVGASQITLWNVNSGEILRVLPGHYAGDIGLEIAPTAIAFSPDSGFLATSTWSQGLLRPDSAIIVRDVTTGEVVLNLAESTGCRQILFDVTGKTIYGACDAGITAWSFPDGEKLFSFAAANPLEAIALSPDGAVMATVDANHGAGKQSGQRNQIQLWQLDGSKSKLLKTLDSEGNDLAQIAFTPLGDRLVSSSYDGKINVWNWQQGTIDRKTNNLYSDEGVFSLSGTGQLIAGNFHSATMTNLATGLPLRNTAQLGQQKSSVMAFNPQQPLFARVENKVDRNSLINLWSAASIQSPKQQSLRDSYQAIPVNKYWINQAQVKTSPIAESQTETQIKKPVSIGKDPQAIALAGLGLAKVATSESEPKVEVEQVTDKLTRVTITQTKLADDSVAAKRYLVEFAPYAETNTQKWQIIWAGEQFKCQSGRGHQDWNTDLCL
jgi:WD40 repeat protein